MVNNDIRMRKALQEKILEKMAAKSFTSYYKYINRNNKRFVFGEYVKFLCEVMERFDRGEIRKLAIFMPPQHGKSSLITESYVSYYVMKNKDRRAMIASYGDDTARKFGEANMDKVSAYGHLFGVELSKTTRSKTNFKLEGLEGGMLSTTIRGSATGFPANLLVVDDPTKGPSDLTAVRRDEVDDNYKRVFKTRLSSDGQEIMIMTRWHTDDLGGRVLDDTWTVVELPCVSLGEDVDLMGRPAGASLFPEVGKDEAWAETTRHEVGEKAWQSMYQQNPIVDGGITIKRDWVKYYGRDDFDITDADAFYQSWDLILKGGEKSDYVVGQTWAIHNKNFYLVDQVRGQWTYSETLDRFDEFQERWGDVCQAILIEDKMNGTNLLNDRRDNKLLKGIVPRGSKKERIERSAIEWEMGNVYLPDWEKFTTVLVDEAVGFGSVKYDDAVDSSAQLINFIRAERLEKKKNAVDFSYKVYKR